MCFENVPYKALYSEKNWIWNGSQTMWNSFQTSAIIAKNSPFPCFRNLSYVRKNVLLYACFGPRTQAAAHVHGPMATLVIYLQKQIFAHLKCYIFHFNTP